MLGLKLNHVSKRGHRLLHLCYVLIISKYLNDRKYCSSIVHVHATNCQHIPQHVIHRHQPCLALYKSMMTSSNWSNFRVTGLLCGEFTGSQWRRWWLETPSRSLWRHCYEKDMYQEEGLLHLWWVIHVPGGLSCYIHGKLLHFQNCLAPVNVATHRKFLNKNDDLWGYSSAGISLYQFDVKLLYQNPYPQLYQELSFE